MPAIVRNIMAVTLELIAGYFLAAIAFCVVATVLLFVTDLDLGGPAIAFCAVGPVGCVLGIAVVVKLFKKKLSWFAIGLSLACCIVMAVAVLKWYVFFSSFLPAWMPSNTIVMMVWPTVVAVDVYNIGVRLRTPGKRNTEK